MGCCRAAIYDMLDVVKNPTKEQEIESQDIKANQSGQAGPGEMENIPSGEEYTTPEEEIIDVYRFQTYSHAQERAENA